MPDLRILAVNPGSASTKLAYFRSEKASFTATLRHRDDEMSAFMGAPVLTQLQYRLTAVLDELRKHRVDLHRLNAVVARGGLLKPLGSGTYRVNTIMLDELAMARRGEHPSNLGAPLAQRLAAESNCPAFVVDPVSVDEWPPMARLSGLAGLDRECLSHALNTKAVAKRFAREQQKPYAELRLIVAHLGSGISVSAHQNGRMVDVTNSRDEGAFSMERAGCVPVMKLVHLCFSGKLQEKEMEAKLFQAGGAFSYVGTRDLVVLVKRIQEGDPTSSLVFDAMVYQIAKEVGAMATVLTGKVDAILVTGGMANSAELVEELRGRVGWIAPIHVYPGEDELQALAEGALRVLRGEEQAKEYV